MKRIYIVILIIVVLLGASIFVVPEGSYVFKYNVWEKTHQPKLLEPGLHFKWPFVQKVVYSQQEPQILTADGSAAHPFVAAQTFDKHTLEIGYGLVWKNIDPKQFYQANQDGNILNSVQDNLRKLLSVSIMQMTLPQVLQLNQQQTLLNQILAKMNKQFEAKGIKFLTLTMTSVDIANAEKSAWLDQMKAQQQNQLTELQQQTSTLTQTLKTSADDKAATIIAKGNAEADKIKADADLNANQIYADAYNKDPQFYEFFHNLQMYKQVLSSKQDVVVLSTHTPFFSSLAAPSNNSGKNKE